jgi:hypothetical protein
MSIPSGTAQDMPSSMICSLVSFAPRPTADLMLASMAFVRGATRRASPVPIVQPTKNESTVAAFTQCSFATRRLTSSRTGFGHPHTFFYA